MTGVPFLDDQVRVGMQGRSDRDPTPTAQPLEGVSGTRPFSASVDPCRQAFFAMRRPETRPPPSPRAASA